MSHDPDYYFKEYGLAQSDLSISMLQLDPADRAVHRIADQRDAVQKKTFTKWVNKHLLKAGRRIVDLFEGFKDGHNLLSLLEVLSGETLPRERGRMKFHQIQNVQIALEFLRRKGIRLVNIRSDEIVDGNPKLTLGLVWTIILHFQISDVVVPGQPEDITAKEALLLWSRRTTDGYPGVQVRDFDKSWQDGKAFLSIIHRNRPDMIDFRRVQTQSNRQNLELAFSTAEREFGVTRLLDPEDVDVPKPDEKSIITYVSSLYDVFPDVPSVEQSLKDNERQLKIDEYKELAVPLVTWLQDVIMMLSQRNFPTTLIEMKSLLSDLNRFKIEDVPPRLEMRKRALRLFDDIQSTGASHLGSEDELYPDNINRLWNRFEHVQQDREMAVQQEIVRLERLQRLAEKLHRESKHSEDSLNDLERRIQDEERRAETLHPFEAKRNCDALERALKTIEDNVHSLLRDAQALQDGRYANSENIYKRVSALRLRVSQLRTELFSNVIQKLISKSYVEEGITTTRRREVVTEVRLVENNPTFRHVQHCLQWIEAKQNAMDMPDYGTDAHSAQMNYKEYQDEHAEIAAFKKEIDKCINDRRNLSPDEQDLYTEWLSKVEVAYSLLSNNSSRRVKGLESLIDFLQAATQELIWLNEKEEVEVTRDWSSSRLNVPSIDEFYKNLLHEMKAREAQFNSVQDRGNSMVLDRHPAAKTIEAYMSQMQSQWSWLLQLSVCLDAHVKYASAYYQFFEEASECEQWMSRQADSINIRYSDDSQSVETLQTLLRELQELSDVMSEYERRVSSLTLRSREIIPLKQRGQPVFSELRCRCLCIYKQPPMVLNKGEEVILLDNSQKIRWRVRTLRGEEDLVPSVCLLIPPPNYEAIEFADRLKIQFDHLQSLLRMRKRKMSKNMVLGTISLIHGWDLAQFQALDPVRREALLRALNEDATKLIAEVGEGDRDMRHLREKLNECNQHFQNLTAAVSEEELRRSRGPDKEFIQRLDSVSYQLSSLEQDLQVRIQQPLPHDQRSMDTARKQQAEWEQGLQNQEGPVEQLRVSYRQLGTSSPQADAKVQFIDEKWDKMITVGNVYAERLKMLDSCLTKLDSLCAFVADQEVALGSQEGMSSNPRALAAQRDELQSLKTSLDQRQSTLDALDEDLTSLRSAVEQSRPGTSRHHDVEDLEKKASNLTTRWNNVKEQVDERLKSMNDGVESLTQYTNGFAEEQQFVAETQNKINAQLPVSSSVEDAKRSVQPAMSIYNSLGEHQHQIEAVNRHGGQYIREAKQLADSYDKLVQDLHNELNWVSDVEQLLKDDQPVSEEAYKAQSQREALKALHDDVLQHQQPIRSLVYQSEQLVEHHQEELTPEQVTELQNLESQIKTAFAKVQKTCESRVKHLSAATDELTKFETELHKFNKWLEVTDKELERQAEAVEVFDNISRVKEQHKDLQSDIVAHAADLRYLSYPVKNYMEESKAHKLELDAYKADRQKPSRLSRTSWIAMDNKEVEVVLEKQKEADKQYHDLKIKCNKFGDKLSQLVSKQKAFEDSTWTMLSWLTDTEEKLNLTRQEASAPEPEALRDHLEKMKALGNDAIAHKNQMAELEKCGKEVIGQMRELGIGGEQVEETQRIINDISDRHDIVSEEINERANDLQTAVTKSQGVQDAVDQLLTWLKETDRKLEQQKPVSLNQDKLNEQAQQLSIIETDIESHKPSVDSVKQAASELIKTCDLDMAKTLEGKISDIGAKFLDVQRKCRSTSREARDVAEKLDRFNDNLDLLKTWVQVNADGLESSEWNKRPIDQLKLKVDGVKMEKERQLQALEQLQSLGHDLIEDPRTGDTTAIKMALANIDAGWTRFEECLTERDSEASLKESKESDYERIKKEVVHWLTGMETDIDSFEPVAVDMDVVAKQIEELQPMIQEYYEFSPKMDELNEVGQVYDAIQSGDTRPKSPMRFRSRRISNMLSPRMRSPSPTMGQFSFTNDITSPMSASSDSSGVGSRKSSSDFLHLDDLSETQQDLVDMNQRYEMLEERLLDRQQELQGMLGSVKSFLQDLADILSWLDVKEKDLEGSVAVATSEKEAKRRLKEHERGHAEVLSKETMVDDIRKKGQDLMKRKRGVPGIDMVQHQLSELDEKWLGVKVSSEQQRKLLEDIVADLKTYKDAGVHLQKWIAQKEKMVAVLGPVATEPSMIKNQLEQVKVLQEELRGQEPLYDKFIQSGNAVHDKCIPESKDAAHITEKMTAISKMWERLSDKLSEREKSLNSVEGLSQEFSDTLQELSGWMSDYMTTLDNLSPVTSTPEKHQEHLREIRELELERKRQIPLLEKTKELAKKLNDNTKDANTKFEIKNKISSVEKPMAEAEKKLQMRSNEVSKMSEQGDKFRGSCQDLMALLEDLKDKQASMEPISGDVNILKKQLQQNKDFLKDLNNLTPEIKDVVDRAKQFGTSSSPAMKSLVDTVKTIQADWEGLREAANDREEQLEASSKHAQSFQAQLDKMSLWLQLTEDKMEGLTPDAMDQDTVAKKLKDAQGLRGDVLKLSYDQELLNREGQSLMDSVDSDKGLVKVRLEDLNQRWDNLNEGLGERIQSLEDLSGKLTDFDECTRDLNATLKKLEDKLDSHNRLGSSAKDPKHQDKIRSLQDDVQGLNSQLDYVDGILQGMDDGESGLPAGRVREVQNAKQKQADLEHQLQELIRDMEAGTQIVDQFQGSIKTAGSHVSQLESELMNMSPVARDESTLKMQERQIEDFISRVNDIDNMLEDLESQYETLKADGYVTASDGLKAQLDMLRNQQEHLREVSDERKAEIKTVSNALEAVTDNLRRMRTSIDRAGDELEMHEPIGSDVNAIKRLQDELKRMKQFQHGVLDNLSRRVQGVTMEAQQLIQGAAPGVDTATVEADQESLMDKWNSLNAKVSERDRNLDNAILQSGKFNDALKNLIDWMKETEDLVANQKSPSPDYKVAKAQLQEQKFLLKMLDDRAPTVKSVKDSGENLQKTLESRERKAIQSQIGQLDKRWDELNYQAGQRSKVLEDIIGIAQEFQEVREPLIGWLDLAEKKFASLEPTAMDTSGIENIIKSLEDMEQEVKQKDDLIKKLASVGKELQNHCKGDDVKNVQRKIDDVQSRFAELSDKLSDTLEQMEEALPLAKNFNDAHAKFIDWLVKMEPKTRHKDANEPEEQVMQLLEEVKAIEPILEVMNSDGNQLAELAPGDAGFKVEDTLAKDLKRFEAVNEAIQNKADKYRASKLKNAEVMCTVEDLQEWFEEEERALIACEPISCTPAKLQKQLADQKAMNDDINAQKMKARDTIAAGKRLIREGSMDDDGTFNNKMEALKQKSDTVAKLGSDRLVQLEQAMPLSRTFVETHQDLLKWFQEVEPAIAELEVMSINQDTVKKQQDRVKVLKQDLQDNKPLVDKLNKTGLALTKLSLKPDDVELVQTTMNDDNKRVEEIRRAVRERSMSIDEALQQSAEFTDKLENMLETLTTTEEMVTNAQPVAAHPDKIREQMADNGALIEDMQMRLSALESVQNAAEELIKQASDSQDDAVKDVKSKLLDLVKLYEKINDGANTRNMQLEDTLEVADKFWDDLNTLQRTMKDLSDTLANQEPPALEPSIIREQQDTLEALREDIEASQFDLDEVHETGEQLLKLCGEPDRPEVQKHIDELDNNLLSITGEFDKRSRTLEEALEKSMHFQDELMKGLVWLQKREDRLKELPPVAGDFNTIKDQWNEVKAFKLEVDPKHADIESLNQKAKDLVKDASPDQSVFVKDPVSAVNKRWDGLLSGISDRQRDLQLAMLNAGQIDHATTELLAWMDKTEQTLDENKPVYGDRKLVEIELAKHKVLQNDISAHEPSVHSVKEACLKSLGSDRSSTGRRKLDDIDRMWNTVQEKSHSRQQELEEALREAKDFSEEMEKVLVRLGQIEGMLITSRPVGGLPETAREQLERFLEVHNELQDMEPVIARLQSDGSQLIRKSQDPASSNIKQNMQLLQQTWEHVKTRSADRKGKLEQAVNQANNFHTDLNTFIAWVTDTEKILNSMKPVSRVIAHVSEQIKDQKALQKDIAVHRESMIKLDKTGTHLKYFSQKQDVVLIKNLLSSVQQRWEKIVSRSAERTRHLERGYKEAEQFSEMLKDLMGWLNESEQNLNLDHSVGNDPVKIKGQIAKHKEFQKSLGAKQPIYDNVNRAGRTLKERSPEEDIPVLNEMLHQLKQKWNALCGKSVDRQRKLEEALLFSGQFNDALDALLDWLAKVEPGLGEDQMVHGDIDTVNNLVEEHKAFQQELGARANNVSFVRKRARELLDKSEEDTSQQQAQLIELTTMWDRVCKLSVNKQERLEQAQKLADDFHKKAQGLIAWLASAERQLRYKGPLPDDEGEIIKQIEEHKTFEEEFLRQEGILRETLNIGQDIMKRCHPDAVSTLKHWLSVLKARWEEVSNWSRQRGNRLRDGLATLRKNNQLLEELIAWLNGAENKLFNDNAEPIPDDIDVISQLMREHSDFQNEMSGKQPEIDQVTKGDRRQRAGSVVGEPVSHIPMYKGLSGRRTPTPVKYGTPRRGRDDDGRRTPETHFKNPRVGALYNKWRQVWLSAMERQRRLQEALDYLNELERMKNFKFDDWRKRYLTWMHHNKSRIMDFFRRQDRDRDGKVTRAEFIEGIMMSRFQTTPMEMEAVANIFDRDGDGYIDYNEFVSALRPNRDPEPVNDSELIQDEVKRQVHKCTCVKQYRIHKIGEGKYRFGDSQKLRLVRILRSTVMVRVGGGWMALDEFLVKNDPCRARELAKGRTNTELREQFTLAKGVSQSMAGFTSKSPSGSSYSGSSTYSGATSPWSARSPSNASGPVIKVREKTAYSTPWRQNMARSGPDSEVHNIMSGTTPDSKRFGSGRHREALFSPRYLQSPATPVSRSSSRASTGSRPFSPTGSETSEVSEPEVFTTVQSETRNVGGRNETTRTYQTHVVQTRNANTPARSSTSTPTRTSKIPKLTPKKR